MTWVIRILALAGTVHTGTNIESMAGMYVTAYDPDAHDGRGDVAASGDPAKALRFASAQGAFNWWKRPSTIRPYREDGMPNRPSSAFTISLEQIEEES
jgi:hypothetical protein